MFSIVVRYLGFLKSVPFFAHYFDSLLKFSVFLTKPGLLDQMDEIEEEILKLDGISVSLHRYGGVQFNYHGREIGHLHGNGLLDLRCSREVKQQLISAGRVLPHHLFKDSGWISFYICSPADKTYAVHLLKVAHGRLACRDSSS